MVAIQTGPMLRVFLIASCASIALSASAPQRVAAGPRSCQVAVRACVAAAGFRFRACRERCRAFGDQLATATCRTGCRGERDRARAACRLVPDPCVVACGQPAAVAGGACVKSVGACRVGTRQAHSVCRADCAGMDRPTGRVCRSACNAARAESEASCGFVVARAAPGLAPPVSLPAGRPADLSLLEEAERARIDEADARAVELRTRITRLWIDAPGADVVITQTRHGFPFGFPIDLRRFNDPDDLAWYADTMSRHFDVAVIENNAKWSKIEPQEGNRTYESSDADVAWAAALGLLVKGHTLFWGIVPPFSSSGVPGWLLARFPEPQLTAAEQDELRSLIRHHVVELVRRYRGRIAIWDVTNETLQPFAQWFVDRLGPGIVNDLFRWAHEADPYAQLLFNEWIVEVFTGLPAPTAADVRDRVLALRAAGVPVHALGQQAHFTPAAAFAGLPVDLSQRTHIDAYAVALDTLAEAGLPVHITETNFIAPDEPELRAAQAEGLMRLWWGHPAVEQIVFWGPWNKVAGRDEFDVGFWDDGRVLTRHGEAVLSLVNDRWRTNVVGAADASGIVEFRAHLGSYAAEWTIEGERVHAVFDVGAGAGAATIALVRP